MPEEENPINDYSQPTIPPDKEYMEISEVVAAKEVEMPEEGNRAKTLTESMDEATDLTDMQFTAARMFPKKLGHNDMMVARLSTDAFLSLLQFRINNRVMTHRPDEMINIDDIVSEEMTILSIGLNGLGREDYAALLGSAREIKKEQELLKGL